MEIKLRSEGDLGFSGHGGRGCVNVPCPALRHHPPQPKDVVRRLSREGCEQFERSLLTELKAY